MIFSNNSGLLPVFVRIVFIQRMWVYCECLTLTVTYITPQDSGNIREKAVGKMPHPEMWKSDENGVFWIWLGFYTNELMPPGENVQNWALLLSILQILYIHLSGNTVVYSLQKQNIKVYLFYNICVIIGNYLYSL